MSHFRLLLATAVATSLVTAAETYREPFARSFPIREQQHLQIKAYADALLREETQRALAAVTPDFTSLATCSSWVVSTVVACCSSSAARRRAVSPDARSSSTARSVQAVAPR